MKRTFMLTAFGKVRTISLFDIAVALFPSVFFLLATVRYWGEPLGLDPMVIYRESTQYYEGGLRELASMGYALHPPLINILVTISFVIFGKSPLSYNLLGTILYCITSIGLYFYLKKRFSRTTAIVTSVLLFCNPLVVVNYFHLGNDALILCALIWGIIAFDYRKYISLGFVLGLMVLMKETALIIVIGLLFAVIVRFIVEQWKTKKVNRSEIRRAMIMFLIPVIIFAWWRLTLKSYNLSEWHDLTFAPQGISSFKLVLQNLYTFGFLNKFLAGNLESLLLFNFQWVYVMFALVFSILFFGTQKFIYTKEQKSVIYTLGFISLSFVILALSFQTFTVLRYSLPCLLLIFLWIGICISSISKRVIKVLVFSILFIVCIVSNFFSVDPVTRIKNPGAIKVHNNTFYNLSWWYFGPDRIIYNLEYFKALETHNRIVKQYIESGADILLTYCDELKLGEKLWSITVNNEFYPSLRTDRLDLRCINDHEISQKIIDMFDQTLFIRSSEAERIQKILDDHSVQYKQIIYGDS